jgi:effector-binding domain-containing protein
MKIALASPLVCLFAALALAPLRAEQQKSGGALVVPEAKLPKGFPRPGKVGQVVIKQYPAYRAARVNSDSTNQNRMFGQLFNHIKKNQIAMTAPVEMTYADQGTSSMALLYAHPEMGEAGQDGSVEVVDVPASTVVSIGVRGDYEAARFQQYRERLETWLEQNKDQWKPAGPARYLGYNSPFVPDFLKYGEVQIPIQSHEG